MKFITKGLHSSSASPLDTLLAAIESGELRSGSRLRETELAETLGVSRTPVREALQRLKAMGLAEPGPQRGLVIARMSYNQLRQLYAVREGLEGMATRLAAEHASPPEVALLLDMVEQDRKMVDSGDPDEMRPLAERNKTLHSQIVRASHNAYMIEALQNLQIHLGLVPGSTYEMPSRVGEAQQEHEDIVSAIKAGDGEAAEAAARMHIRNGYRYRLQLMSETQLQDMSR